MPQKPCQAITQSQPPEAGEKADLQSGSASAVQKTTLSGANTKTATPVPRFILRNARNAVSFPKVGESGPSHTSRSTLHFPMHPAHEGDSRVFSAEIWLLLLGDPERQEFSEFPWPMPKPISK
jgi:hypothetical protein